ncbi:hypothetical protein AYI68_g2985 [Smittium mucronatum]|uniref:Uncharacterized protein n=1 Tax=Smittium mucronatum TaxID=133383 RepID=A0A1R0H167_9FUNG|nr:hypothetical protein AYI68_g2985 [Smittium mucronatum]
MHHTQTQNTDQASTSSNSGHSPMEIDCITTRLHPPLSVEEKQRLRELGLCLYCGQPGHIIPDSTLKSASEKCRYQRIRSRIQEESEGYESESVISDEHEDDFFVIQSDPDKMDTIVESPKSIVPERETK